MAYFTHEQISQHIIRIREASLTAVYLVLGDKKAALIDTGIGLGSLRTYVESICKRLVDMVILTHGHLDHANGVSEYADVPVYLNPLDKDLMRQHADVAKRLEYTRDIWRRLGKEAPDLTEKDAIPAYDPNKTLPLQHGQNGNDVVIGIGGGKILDTAKAVAYYLNVPVIICPTIAGTDTPCSALAVVYTEEGIVEEYLFLKSNPNMVIMDSAVIAKSPVRMTVSGMGDALATYFEAGASYKHDGPNFANGKALHTGIALGLSGALLCHFLSFCGKWKYQWQPYIAKFP